jgi:hypothetical protein
MVDKPPNDLCFERLVGWVHSESRMVGFTSRPASIEGFEQVSSLEDVAKVALKVTEHEVCFVIHERARRSSRNSKDCITLKETETIRVERVCSNLIGSFHPQRCDLLT